MSLFNPEIIYDMKIIVCYVDTIVSTLIYITTTQIYFTWFHLDLSLRDAIKNNQIFFVHQQSHIVYSVPYDSPTKKYLKKKYK